MKTIENIFEDFDKGVKLQFSLSLPGYGPSDGPDDSYIGDVILNFERFGDIVERSISDVLLDRLLCEAQANWASFSLVSLNQSKKELVFHCDYTDDGEDLDWYFQEFFDFKTLRDALGSSVEEIDLEDASIFCEQIEFEDSTIKINSGHSLQIINEDEGVELHLTSSEATSVLNKALFPGWRKMESFSFSVEDSKVSGYGGAGTTQLTINYLDEPN